MNPLITVKFIIRIKNALSLSNTSGIDVSPVKLTAGRLTVSDISVLTERNELTEAIINTNDPARIKEDFCLGIITRRIVTIRNIRR